MAFDHPAEALPPGYCLGQYEVLRVLGRGGFGITYQARRLGRTGEMVAIKELFPKEMARRGSSHALTFPPGPLRDDFEQVAAMFLREAEIICNLNHPNIVRGVEAFPANNTAYLVMSYVSGRSLRQSLRDPQGFKPDLRNMPALLHPLLDALETLHGNGLLHCDIKTDNIFLGIGFAPILIDMGSARVHAADGVAEEASTYSQHYSAIEQIDPAYGPVGPWTDIYQLAAVFYRIISGGVIPDAAERAGGSGDPMLPLMEMPELSAVWPAEFLGAIDAGLRLQPASRPQGVTGWRPMFGIPSPVAEQKGWKTIFRRRRESEPSPPPAPSSIPADPEICPSPALSPVGSSGQESGPDFLMWAAGLLVLLIVIIAICLLVFSE